MTEQEWLSSNDPAEMFDFLVNQSKNEIELEYFRSPSNRKVRLFACARVYAMSISALNDTTCRDALFMAEKVADGNSHDPRARMRAMKINNAQCFGFPCATCLVKVAIREPFSMLHLLIHGRLYKRDVHIHLLRDILGNPFRSIRPIEWIVPDVYSLAKAAYDEREEDGKLDKTRLSILADALEDDGCYPLDEQIVTHLRSAGPHYRGMWSLDIVRGLE